MGSSLGTAYVQIVPTFGGKGSLTSAMTKGLDMPGAGSQAGGRFGGAFSSSLNQKISAGAVMMGNLLADAAKKAVSVAADVVKQAFTNYADYEQYLGGIEKIFDDMDTSRIYEDASRAYMELNMSANEYMAALTDVGATFSATMGDEKGYDTARRGMLAISDYASGTGRSVDELNEKYKMISRSTSSYQSIADQFSGILPATSKDFLEQAQAAGYLSSEYTSLTEVPIDEYQEALTYMLEDGTAALGLQGNTAAEAADTISGSLAAMRAAWQDWTTSLMSGDDKALGDAMGKLLETVGNFMKNLVPVVIQGIRELIASIPSLLGGLGDIGIQIADQIWPGFADAFNEGLSGALDGSAFEGLIEAGQRLKEAWEEAIAPFTENMPTIEETAQRIGEVIGTIVDFLERLGTGILDGLRSVFENETFQAAIQALKDAFDHLKEALAPIGEALGAINDHAGGIGEVIGKILGYGLEGVIWVIAGAIQAVAGFIQGLITVVQTVAEAISTAVEWIREKWQGLVSFFQGIPGTITGFFSNIGSSISGFFQNAVSRVKGWFNSLVDFVRGIPDKIVGFFRNIGDRILNFFRNLHFPTPHLSGSLNPLDWGSNPPHIDWYASGAIFMRPTILGSKGVGDVRGGEAVLPIRKLLPMIEASVAEVDGMGTDASYVIAWLATELGPVIREYAPTATPREFSRMVRSAV